MSQSQFLDRKPLGTSLDYSMQTGAMLINPRCNVFQIGPKTRRSETGQEIFKLVAQSPRMHSETSTSDDFVVAF